MGLLRRRHNNRNLRINLFCFLGIKKSRVSTYGLWIITDIFRGLFYLRQELIVVIGFAYGISLDNQSVFPVRYALDIVHGMGSLAAFGDYAIRVNCID